MSTYRHLFFDLDRTLWDFDANSREALGEIHDLHNLESLGIHDLQDFISRYERINEHYWNLYRTHQIDKKTLRSIRFEETLREYQIKDPELSLRLADDYVRISPVKTRLFPGTTEVLNYLANKYVLHIITNGFEEVQHIKLERSGLRPFFEEVITSEKAGHKKPGAEIFHYAFRLSGAVKKESIMVGDDLEADIRGARGVGIDHVFFNPNRIAHKERVTHEISALSELKKIF